MFRTAYLTNIKKKKQQFSLSLGLLAPSKSRSPAAISRFAKHFESSKRRKISQTT